MMAVKRKTTVDLVIPLVLYYLQGLAQSDPEQSTEAKPILKYTIPINSNNQPEMMVSSSIPTASPSPLPERCAPHRIFGISWSPDNIHMAVGINSGLGRINHSTLPDCPYSGAVQIFDMSEDEPKLLHTLTHATDRVRDVAYNHDGTQLAAATGNKVLVYDATDFTSTPTSLIDATENIFSITYNHNGTQLAFGEGGGQISQAKIKIYDGMNPVSGSNNLNLIETRVSGGLFSIAYNTVVTQLAVGVSGSVRVYDVMNPSSPSLISTLPHTGNSVRSVVYNHSGTQLASGDGDGRGTVRIYDGMNPTSDSFQELTDATGQIYSIDYNPNDTRLAVAGVDDTVRIYDATNLPSPPIHVIDDATENVRKVAYDHTGGLLAVGGDDQMLRIYQVVVPDSPTPSPTPSAAPTQTQDSGSSGSVTTALSLTAFMAVFWAMVLP